MDNKPEGRCTGHCCVVFPLPYSPEQIRAMADRVTSPITVDIVTIADMIFPIDWVPAEGEAPSGLGNGHFMYGCKHLKANGDCAIYERRPRMCSGYPYGARCQFRDCTREGEIEDKGDTQPKDKVEACQTKT